MPLPVRVDLIIITPKDSVATLQAALGIAPSSPVCTIADPTPREVTHYSWNGGVSAEQRAAVEDHLANSENNPALADSIFVWWPRNQPNPYAATLAANGLTLVSDPDNP